MKLTWLGNNTLRIWLGLAKFLINCKQILSSLGWLSTKKIDRNLIMPRPNISEKRWTFHRRNFACTFTIICTPKRWIWQVIRKVFFTNRFLCKIALLVNYRYLIRRICSKTLLPHQTDILFQICFWV